MGVISVHIHPPTREFIAQFRESLERMSGSLQAEAAYLQCRNLPSSIYGRR